MVLRKCQACGKIQERNCMIKITKLKNENILVLNPTQKECGRSVYFCSEEDCIKKIIKKKIIQRNLKCSNHSEVARIESQLNSLHLNSD